MSSLENCLLRSSDWVVFLLLGCMSCLYVWRLSPCMAHHLQMMLWLSFYRFFFFFLQFPLTSLVAQTVKRLSTMWETWVQALGREDPLEKEMAIHSSTVAWKIPWTEEPGRLQSMGSQRVGHD